MRVTRIVEIGIFSFVIWALLAIGSSSTVRSQQLSAATTPTPTPKIISAQLQFNPGLNFISIPVIKDSLYTSMTFLAAINGGVPVGQEACTEVNAWDKINQKWSVYTISNPSQNIFGIYFGEGYMVKCNKSAALTVTGEEAQQKNMIYSLYNGTNSISYSVPDSGFTASALLGYINTDIHTKNGCTQAVEIDRWINSSWQAYISGYSFNNFPIDYTPGYLVKCVIPTPTNTPTPSATPTPTVAPLPTPTIISVTTNLNSGWNLINMPVRKDARYTSQSLLQAINGQGGDCIEADMWGNGTWIGYIKDKPFNIFFIDDLVGYFIRCNKASVWNETGEQYKPEWVSYTLKQGWNLIAYPVPPGLHPVSGGRYYAVTFVAYLNTQRKENCDTVNELDRWINSAWEGYILNYPFNNYPISMNMGYFARCDVTTQSPKPLPVLPTIVPSPTLTPTPTKKPTPTKYPLPFRWILPPVRKQ